MDARIQKGQKTHRQLAPLFTNKDVFLHEREITEGLCKSVRYMAVKLDR